MIRLIAQYKMQYWPASRNWTNLETWDANSAGIDACLAYLQVNYDRRTDCDFVLRVIRDDTDYIVKQYACQRGTMPGGNEQYPDIEWNFSPSPIRTLTGEIKYMITVGIRRIAGKLTLLVNARDFHTELDKIGVTHDGARYNDRPASAFQIASSSFVMSTDVLLKRDYRSVKFNETKDGATKEIELPVTAAIDLSGIWTNPPSFENLKKLCNSANDVARKILEHYQPIDISVEIHKKVVK